MSVNILGESSAVHELKSMIRRVATAKTNVLIIGESGTGKELVARMIHDSGPFRTKPFVPVNCGAIPETLIESEMFGHRKGSFTGAINDKIGLFEAAHEGTLFLDEIGELSLSMQVKLLRAIQERSFRKVGGLEDVRVDVRIIAATNRDLENAIEKGTFREDLFYRLNVIQIKTPPLREREGDVRLLAEHFMKKFATKNQKILNGIAPDALLALERHRWPGNVRELENVLERAVTLESESQIGLRSLPKEFQTRGSNSNSDTRSAGTTGSEIRLPAPDFSKGSVDLDSILGELEKIYLQAALKNAGGVKKKAAQLLSVTFRSLRYRLKKLGLADSED